MQTVGQTTEEYEDEEVINLGELADDYLRCARRYWVLLLFMALVAAGLTAWLYGKFYKPVYEAKVTYAVNWSDDSQIDAAIASRLAGAFSTLTEDVQEYEDDMEAALGDYELSGEYTVAAVYTEESTLITLTVSAESNSDANAVLTALESVYPQWAASTTGAVELQTVDHSEAGGKPVESFPYGKMLLYCLLAAFIVCFVFATIYVRSVKTVRNESGMKKVTEKQCLSLLPEMRMKKRSKKDLVPIVTDKRHTDWGFRESIYSLQSRIENQMKKDDAQVLAICSAMPQEGRSLLAANLALSFARQGKKVLLMEGDFRNPSLGRILGAKLGKGLSEFMAGDGNVSAMLVRRNGVDILPAGSKQATATMIDDRRMRSLMKQLREVYAYILIDTPPSHLYTDASIWMRYADVSLYVVRHDSASENEVRDGLESLGHYERLLGYVINRIPGSFRAYGKYGYGSGYGYGRYGRYGRYGHYGRYGYGHYGHYHQLEEEAEKKQEDSKKKKEEMNTEDTL